jgi:hypothetical protein
MGCSPLRHRQSRYHMSLMMFGLFCNKGIMHSVYISNL